MADPDDNGFDPNDFFNLQDFIYEPPEEPELPPADPELHGANQAGPHQPVPEPPEIGLEYIEQDPMQDLLNAWDMEVEPPAFQGMPVQNLQDAQNEIAVAQEEPVLTREEFRIKMLLEKETICCRMLGMLNQQTRSWRTYLHQPGAGYIQDHQFVVELYLYLNEFLLQPPGNAPPPRHVKRTCDMNTDPMACCFNNLFGDFVANEENDLPALRQRALFQMFATDITQVLTNMFQETGARKNQSGLYPDHVHVIMEDWWAHGRHTAQQDGIQSVDAEEQMLAALSGLSLNAVRNYKKKMPRQRYDFATRQMVPREQELPQAPAAAVAGPAGPGQPQRSRIHRRISRSNPTEAQRKAMDDCIQRNPGAAYVNLPQQEKNNLCQVYNCSQNAMRVKYRLRRKLFLREDPESTDSE